MRGPLGRLSSALPRGGGEQGGGGIGSRGERESECLVEREGVVSNGALGTSPSGACAPTTPRCFDTIIQYINLAAA